MKTVCRENACAGCYACVSACGKNAIAIVDTLDALNAAIDPEKCVKCGRCSAVCPVNHSVERKEPAFWVEGWAQDRELRKRAGSGGFASSIAEGFLRGGGRCYTCVFRDGAFLYESITDVFEMQGSKYVKSVPGSVFRQILADLDAGLKVLFIGLPCHVAGLKSYAGDRDQLYTMDLICHGSPSAKLMQSFLAQYQIDLQEVEEIRFRSKAHSETEGFHSFAPSGIEDCYSFAFLQGLNFTENCYACPYTGTERCSDLTIGDAWGSLSSKEQIRMGISIGLCMSEKGKSLLELGKLKLEAADAEAARLHNRQLRCPMPMPLERERFFSLVKDGERFNKAVRRCYKTVWLKQDLKTLLIRLGLCKKDRDLTYGLLVKKSAGE